jgi:hypothetical protein
MDTGGCCERSRVISALICFNVDVVMGITQRWGRGSAIYIAGKRFLQLKDVRLESSSEDGRGLDRGHEAGEFEE